MSDPVFLPVPGTFGLVGFDAADIVGGALHQSLDQAVRLFLKGKQGQFYLLVVLPVVPYSFVCGREPAGQS